MATRVISQTIDLTNKPINKYITEINQNGIKVHAENNFALNYVQITPNGMEIFKTNGASSNPSAISVANFGEIVRIGVSDTGHSVVKSDGLHVWIGAESTASNEVAVFGSTATIGASNTRHIEIKDGGMQVYQDASTVMAHIGYGSGKNQSGGTSNAPYFTLGNRILSTLHPAGNYSLAEGYGNTAEGYASHSEGYSNQATNLYAHAEGYQNVASGIASHAEGIKTTASGNYSHAEGYNTEASGENSHASGWYTMASGDDQTVVGRCNATDLSALFIVGNGTMNPQTGVLTRSNAFTVSSSGHINIAGGVTLGSEKAIIATSDRANSSGGGWAYEPFYFINVSGQQMAKIGLYGTNATSNYIYIGANSYNGNNLRVYPDGHIWANGVTSNVTGNVIGNVTGNCSGSSGSCTGNAASATYLKDRTYSTATYTNYGASGLAGSAISWLACWNKDTSNNYELRAISKAEVFNVVRDNGGDSRWVNVTGDTMTGLLKITTNSNTVTIGSQNSSWCHFTNSADIPFYFNKSIGISGTIGTSSYPATSVYVSGSVLGNSSRNLVNNATSNQCHVGNSSDNLYLYGLTSGSSGSTLKTSGNRIYYDSSSRKYKHSIQNLSDKTLDPEKLYDLEVRQFIFNDDFLTEEDERYHKLVVGLIAEEVYEKYPIAANLYKGEPEDWNERYIIPPMLKLIQNQHKEIEQLKKEVQELKNK